MKTWLRIALVLSGAASSNQCSADEADLLKRLESVERRLDALETHGQNIEALRNALGITKKPAKASDDKSDLSIHPPAFEVKLLSIKQAGVDIFGKPAAEIEVAVTNKGQRDAEVINAYLNLRDKAGNLVLRAKWEKNRGIKSGAVRKVVSEYSTFMGDEPAHALELGTSNLIPEFEIYKIAFAGGEIVEYQECMTCDF
jgi:hypothetical protein